MSTVRALRRKAEQIFLIARLMEQQGRGSPASPPGLHPPARRKRLQLHPSHCSQLLSLPHPGAEVKLLPEIPYFCLTFGAVLIHHVPCATAPETRGEEGEVCGKAELAIKGRSRKQGVCAMKGTSFSGMKGKKKCVHVFGLHSMSQSSGFMLLYPSTSSLMRN